MTNGAAPYGAAITCMFFGAIKLWSLRDQEVGTALGLQFPRLIPFGLKTVI